MDRYLLYFADPMCSWCWGFAPVTEKIQKTFGDKLPIRLFMGGLRPGNTQPWNDSAKAKTREHWEHVHEASGQPFDFSFFEREGWVYDTDPAARAVVTARRLDESRAMDFLRAVHKAFYTEARDVTDTDELVKVAEEFGFDGANFRETFEAPETQQETQADYWYSQQAGIRGFPALLAVADQKAAAVTFGYQPWEAIGPALEGWMNGPEAEAPAT
jgi:putative protein-disulfide isomerase